MDKIHRDIGALGAHDGVVMLTWSNWATEPRSNRYHYASRFAKLAAVVFLQPTLSHPGPVTVEACDVPGMDVVSFHSPMDEAAVQAISDLLAERGVRKPLLWIYSSLHYDLLLRSWPQPLRVYHATEDYLTFSAQLSLEDQRVVAESVFRLLPQVDLLVGVSQRVVDTYVGVGGHRGATVLAPNGCDAEFFLGFARQHPPSADGRPSCIFQGGVNRRLDFALLQQLARQLPEWEFRFCGRVEPGIDAWDELCALPNVSYLGVLGPAEVACAMCAATVGVIPFAQAEWIRNSLPLKAYEYVAAGLPVVSIPIDALASRPDLFRFASTAEDWAEAIRAAAPSRLEAAALAAREAAARDNSYDGRFSSVLQAVERTHGEKRRQPKRLSVAVLYDDGSVHVSTVREHLEAFARYSRHQVTYIPATGKEFAQFRWSDRCRVQADGPDLSTFDVAVVHYSMRISTTHHVPAGVRKALARFLGLRVLFIQDEYDNPPITLRWMEEVQPDLVYTCVPLAERERVYSSSRFPRSEFLPTLTGYVPEDPSIDSHAMPARQRKLLIAYRGRKLPAIYGQLGWEKYLIGKKVRELADARGIPVDIEVDDDKRMYGTDWYRFLGSATATLGTESGSNLFDFDGTAAAEIKAEQARNPDAGYASMADRLRPYEQAVHMNQVSPKIFEAIRTRTVLVLFEGEYSGVVQAGVHYVALKRDFSNFDEVVRQLQDPQFVRAITQRAFDDVIRSGNYSYQRFMENVDADLEGRVARVTGQKLFSVPLFVRSHDGHLGHLQPLVPEGLLLGTHACDEAEKRALAAHAKGSWRLWTESGQELEDQPLASNISAQTDEVLKVVHPSGTGGPWDSMAHACWASMPSRVRRGASWRLQALAQGTPMPPSMTTTVFSSAWRLAPGALKRVVARAARPKG